MKKIIFLFLFFPFLLLAQEEPQDSLALIRQLHLKGVEGDKKAVEEAYSLLLPLVEKEPGNPLYQVYQGSCLTLKARDALWPPKKLEYARQGFKTMDAAVAASPNNEEVRFIRAMCALNVPKFFNRLDQALEDFDTLIASLEPAQSPSTESAMIYYYAACGYVKNADKEKALPLLEKSIQTDSGTKWKSASEQMLKKVSLL